MKQLVIVSGKGGTGKTSIAAGFAELASKTHKLVIADVDVDAANMALVMSPRLVQTQDFSGGKIATIDPTLCTACGICKETCRFDAILQHPHYHVDPVACEGCAACYYQCPVDAICMKQQTDGTWSISNTAFGKLYHAHLYAGQENSGKLVTLVKSKARLYAMDSKADILLVDGPPGIGCPVIAAVAGADLVLIVTEPSVAGAHDMERILGLAEHFRIPAVVIINKADLNTRQTQSIEAYCTAHHIPIAGHIPYDNAVTESMVQGLTMIHSEGPLKNALQHTWEYINTYLRQH